MDKTTNIVAYWLYWPGLDILAVLLWKRFGHIKLVKYLSNHFFSLIPCCLRQKIQTKTSYVKKVMVGAETPYLPFSAPQKMNVSLVPWPSLGQFSKPRQEFLIAGSHQSTKCVKNGKFWV